MRSPNTCMAAATGNPGFPPIPRTSLEDHPHRHENGREGGQYPKEPEPDEFPTSQRVSNQRQSAAAGFPN